MARPILPNFSTQDFSEYYRELHGQDPLSWENHLYNLTAMQATDGDIWPNRAHIPTNARKTAIIDIALFLQVTKPHRYPKRIVFVTDRQLSANVIQDHVSHLQQKIANANTPILQRVRNLIKNTNGDVILGGIASGGEYPRRPDLPWIEALTIEQFGSRLLFRGYGAPKTMRPVLAGLAGVSSLVVLDQLEEHTLRPFLETLTAVKSDCFYADELPKRNFEIMEISSIPLDISDKEAYEKNEFKNDQYDFGSQENRKVARLVEIGKPRQKPDVVISEKIEKMILEGELPSEVKCVGIIVNLVQTARKVHRMLIKAGCDSHLITGRMRPLDAVQKIGQLAEVTSPDQGSRAVPDEAVFVVGTQAVETSNFSFDLLITECAPVGSLKQRFSLLHRHGSDQQGDPAKCWILGVKSELALAASGQDHIYGGAAKATWDELTARAKNKPDAKFPLNITAQSEDISDFPSGVCDSAGAPLLLPTYIEAWVQSNPEPVINPDITPFLQGKNTGYDGNVNLVWRWDCSEETLRIAPPRPAEFLPVPIEAVKAWLAADAKPEVPIADIALSSTPKVVKLQTGNAEKPKWYRWENKKPVSAKMSDLVPGDILLVSPDSGGIRCGNWDPQSAKTVEDLGDKAQAAYQHRTTIRLDTSVYPKIGMPSQEWEGSDQSAEDMVAEWLEHQQKNGSDLADLAGSLGSDYIIRVQHPGRLHFANPYTPYYVLYSTSTDLTVFDGTDETLSSTGTGTSLKKHSKGVAKTAAEFALMVGLSEEMQQDFRLAGHLHDIGKVDTRHQYNLVGGDKIKLACMPEPLAKSCPRVPPGWVDSETRYEDMRHEVGSLALIKSNPAVLNKAHNPDLVLHLIATHHGYARPLPQIVEDPNPQKIAYTHNGKEMETDTDYENTILAIENAERFSNLTKKYGHHGLAWLESIFRLAEQHQTSVEKPS